MYTSISKNYAVTRLMKIGIALITPILLTTVLIFSLTASAQANPIQQASDYTNDDIKEITGRVTWADGSPAEGIKVTASNQDDGWYPAYSDPNGYYTLTLPDGTWQISIDTIVQYDLEQGDLATQSLFAVLILHDQWYSTDIPHTVQFAADDSSETHAFDIGLQRVNSLITGTLRRPDGTPLTDTGPNSVNVRAYSAEFDVDSRFAQIDLATGVYTVAVASGSWNLSYSLRNPNIAELYEVGIADPVSITVGANSAIQQDLIIEEYDARINGTVLRTDTGEPVLGGSVSITNGNDYRYADVDEDGRFRIPVRSGTTWQVEARWGQNFEAVIYPVSWEGVVTVADAGEVEITIGGILVQDEAAFLPLAFGW